ncbi:hypothetical protein AB9P05_18920 [Roseivirga sp. BDSF3-8]|uniref:hypothetical protein n=1 Tax=Roseivirga sp. BDSF3-8 TaxID=3241598 RepID=UPI003532279D
MTLVYNERHARVVYLPESSTLYCTWLKGTTPEQYRDVFNHILKGFQDYGAKTYLSDIQKQGIVGTESRKWLESTIIPEALKAGMRNIFVITSEDAFKKFYLDRVKNEVEKQSTIINTQYFPSEESALKACKAEVEKMSSVA